MKELDEYEIPIHGLKEGIHSYEFEIKDSFFEYFNNPDLPGGSLKLKLDLQKRPQFIELDFNLIGNLRLICDRCLDEFDFDVDLSEKLFLRFGEEYEELDDNIVVIPRSESRVNIAQYVYEFTALSIPFQKVHPDTGKGKPGCNPDMIRRLNELKVEENKISTKNTDPRWDKLKNLN